MATIIETRHGFIAGDPPATVPAGHHWCTYCQGDGLGYDYDEQEVTTCDGCFGACTTECDDMECEEHSSNRKALAGSERHRG